MSFEPMPFECTGTAQGCIDLTKSCPETELRKIVNHIMKKHPKEAKLWVKEEKMMSRARKQSLNDKERERERERERVREEEERKEVEQLSKEMKMLNPGSYVFIF
jgi:hypothetical protein